MDKITSKPVYPARRHVRQARIAKKDPKNTPVGAPGALAPDRPNDIPASLREFRLRRQPLVPVAVVAAALIGALFTALHAGLWSTRLFDQHKGARLLFAGYFLVTVAMWLVYFASYYDLPGCSVRTLRKLLSKTSELFGSRILTENECRTDALADAYRDKARTSVTMLAMLSAGAALIFTRALDKAHLDPATSWGSFTAMGAAGAAIVALICFIVSVDCYDVMYNLFGAKGSLARAHMLQFFYGSTRNTRYYGVMFLLWSICLFASSYDPQFGAFSAGMMVAVGWAHWFPLPPEVGSARGEGERSKFGYFLRVLFVGVPVLWLPGTRVWEFLCGG